MIRQVSKQYDVLVIGGGPAGMECAMVLGKRGMSAVHLLDENEALGGSLRAISAYPPPDQKWVTSTPRETCTNLMQNRRVTRRI